MREDENPEHSAFEKLQRILEEQDGLFTSGEARVLRRFANVLLALETLGSIGVLIRSILLWIGGMIAIWFAFTNGLGDWLRKLIGQ